LAEYDGLGKSLLGAGLERLEETLVFEENICDSFLTLFLQAPKNASLKLACLVPGVEDGSFWMSSVCACKGVEPFG